MEALKERYMLMAMKNLWKLKEYQVLNNQRSLKQITQFEYEEKLNGHPEIYQIEMRHTSTDDNPALILEISDAINSLYTKFDIDHDDAGKRKSIEKGLSADSISQMFGIWPADIQAILDKKPGNEEKPEHKPEG